MSEQLGIAKGVGFGMRDCSSPVLWFEVSTLAGNSLQVFGMDETARIVKEANVRDIRQLEGRACVVEVERHAMVFLRWHK